MKKIKVSIIILAVIICAYTVWCQTYSFDFDKATSHLTEHGRNLSIVVLGTLCEHYRLVDALLLSCQLSGIVTTCH